MNLTPEIVAQSLASSFPDGIETDQYMEVGRLLVALDIVAVAFRKLPPGPSSGVIANGNGNGDHSALIAALQPASRSRVVSRQESSPASMDASTTTDALSALSTPPPPRRGGRIVREDDGRRHPRRDVSQDEIEKATELLQKKAMTLNDLRRHFGRGRGPMKRLLAKLRARGYVFTQTGGQYPRYKITDKKAARRPPPPPSKRATKVIPDSPCSDTINQLMIERLQERKWTQPELEKEFSMHKVTVWQVIRALMGHLTVHKEEVEGWTENRRGPRWRYWIDPEAASPFAAATPPSPPAT